jgi:hypothetical protein
MLFTRTLPGDPVLILMMIMYYGLPPLGVDMTPFMAVVIALTLYNGSVMAEVFRAGIASLPTGQTEAGYAIGHAQVGRHARVRASIRRRSGQMLPDDHRPAGGGAEGHRTRASSSRTLSSSSLPSSCGTGLGANYRFALFILGLAIVPRFHLTCRGSACCSRRLAKWVEVRSRRNPRISKASPRRVDQGRSAASRRSWNPAARRLAKLDPRVSIPPHH